MKYEVIEITLAMNDGETIRFSDGQHIVAVLKAVESKSKPGTWYITAMTETDLGHE